MGNTEKVGSTGRFGSRYGVGIRKRLLKIESRSNSKRGRGAQGRKCPNCGFNTVKRLSKGVFDCRKCSHQFVGGAYLPQTLTGGIISQMVSQKKFVPEMIAQLEKAGGEETITGAVESKEEEKEGEN
mgnify:CR=1 FL=1